jgi:hypothetical protein
MTFGLYDDGWTKPGRPARIRVFATRTMTRPRLRYLGLGVLSTTERPFTIASNRQRVHALANGGDRVFNIVAVCVPPHGYSDVRLTSRGRSQIYGDPRNAVSAFTPRFGSVLLTEVAVANEIGPAC